MSFPNDVNFTYATPAKPKEQVGGTHGVEGQSEDGVDILVGGVSCKCTQDATLFAELDEPEQLS